MIVDWVSEDRTDIRSLFEAHKRARAVIFPALDQGRGYLWTNSLETPTVARLRLAIFNALAGDSTSPDAKEIVQMIEPMRLVFGPDEGWTQLIKDLWGDRLGIQHRTLFSPNSLDIDYLQHLRNLTPPGYSLERMDLETIKGVDKRRAMHIPTLFGSSEDFFEMGIAYCIKHDGKVVSMASTLAPFVDEFEIQVDTSDPEHRRKGLATAVSAALMIHALENDLIPYWDAANEISIELALKLGFTDPDRWEAYYLKPESNSG